MKMKFETEINAGRELVWAIFNSPDKLSRWQPTLESFTHLAGDPGQPGAVSELVYNENGKKVTMTETVTERRKPHFMEVSYANDWATSLIFNHF